MLDFHMHIYTTTCVFSCCLFPLLAFILFFQFYAKKVVRAHVRKAKDQTADVVFGLAFVLLPHA